MLHAWLPDGLAQWVALLAVLWAGVQIALASRRDLGPMTIGVSGTALLLAYPDGSPYVALAVTVAMLLSAVAWARASAHGVGRPGLNGLALATVVISGLLPWWLPSLLPGGDPQRLVDVALMPCILVGGVGGILALERPGPRRTRVKWVGAIPIQEVPIQEGKDAE